MAGPPWPAGAAWIDGQYRPVGDAKISVLDLGVTRSDCTYDVVHVWEGRFYRLDAHLDRFAAHPEAESLYWASHEDPRYATPVRY